MNLRWAMSCQCAAAEEPRDQGEVLPVWLRESEATLAPVSACGRNWSRISGEVLALLVRTRCKPPVRQTNNGRTDRTMENEDEDSYPMESAAPAFPLLACDPSAPEAAPRTTSPPPNDDDRSRCRRCRAARSVSYKRQRHRGSRSIRPQVQSQARCRRRHRCRGRRRSRGAPRTAGGTQSAPVSLAPPNPPGWLIRSGGPAERRRRPSMKFDQRHRLAAAAAADRNPATKSGHDLLYPDTSSTVKGTMERRPVHSTRRSPSLLHIPPAAWTSIASAQRHHRRPPQSRSPPRWLRKTRR